MSYDNICKYLAEQYPESFVKWLLNTESERVEVLKTELSSEPIRADALVLLQVSQQILQLEFQTVPYSTPPIPNRMLEYKGRLLREYSSHSIEQIVIFLKSTNSELAHQNQYQDTNTTHRYRIIRLWEENVSIFLTNPNLLPFATLVQSDNPNHLLEQIAKQVAMIEDNQQRQEILACSSILAGLRFSDVLINALFREEIMRESVVYQRILQEGRQQGLQQGLQQGELAILQRILSSRFGELSPEIDEILQSLSSTQLENLGAAIWNFSTIEDLRLWLGKKSLK